MTGVTIFHELKPEQSYEYQMGWLSQDRNESSAAELPVASDLDWSTIERHQFHTAAEGIDTPRRFVFGSCRYLLKLFGGLWFEDRGDKTFRSILEQIENKESLDLMLMLGDQIYADDLLILAPDRWLDEYNARYRDVFSQPHIRRLMSQLPTYMMLDDHEIEDNWPRRASARDRVTKFPVAIHALLTYQLSHSPLYQIADNGITGVPDKLWYTFSNGCCDFFMMDVRTERQLSEDEEERQMINEVQMEALKKWLSDESGRVKLIGSSVPFFPDFRRRNADKWHGFLRQRTEILEYIHINQIRRVVFFSGDIHKSTAAELTHRHDPDFKIISIISTPFFWPFPLLEFGEILQSEGPLDVWSEEGQISAGAYHVQSLTPVRAIDCFTRVTVTPESIRSELFDRKGNLVGTTDVQF
ncbi:alkaline phosphatase family protein [Chloroflexi bacterium TSY]|nr:alkaline phosphatase family protein [Chloroflexi bacterium TSY]